MESLIIKDLYVEVDDVEILKGVNLEIKKGETIALLGPNGHGKSTLLNVLMGHPKYHVTRGSITLDSKDVLKMKVDERSKAGLFLAMQYPVEIPGVVNSDFLKMALNSHREKSISLYEFYSKLQKASEAMKIPLDMATRFLNAGFSGGEKKRNEILQLLLLNPELALLDEIDSGLDVDALRLVGDEIAKKQEEGMSFLVVSHYARLYEIIHPTKVAVMINGVIVTVGEPELVEKIDKEGYEWMAKEFGIKVEKEEKAAPTSLGFCATKKIVEGK